MKRWSVEIHQIEQHRVEVEAEDEEGAIDAAYSAKLDYHTHIDSDSTVQEWSVEEIGEDE